MTLAVPERTNEVAGQYAAAAEALAAELGVPCLNVWAAFQAIPGWERKLLCDGLHLTPEGQQEVYRLLRALIDERFPDLRVAKLPMDAPDHSWIDPDSVPAAFSKHWAEQQQRAQQQDGTAAKEEL